jgi:hypothetical protein
MTGPYVRQQGGRGSTLAAASAWLTETSYGSLPVSLIRLQFPSAWLVP